MPLCGARLGRYAGLGTQADRKSVSERAVGSPQNKAHALPREQPGHSPPQSSKDAGMVADFNWTRAAEQMASVHRSCSNKSDKPSFVVLE